MAISDFDNACPLANENSIGTAITANQTNIGYLIAGNYGGIRSIKPSVGNGYEANPGVTVNAAMANGGLILLDPQASQTIELEGTSEPVAGTVLTFVNINSTNTSSIEYDSTVIATAAPGEIVTISKIAEEGAATDWVIVSLYKPADLSVDVDDGDNGTADDTTWAMSAVTDTSTTDQSVPIMNNFATLAAKINELIAAMVSAGIMKDS